MIDTYQSSNIRRLLGIITAAVLGGGFLIALISVVYILGEAVESLKL